MDWNNWANPSGALVLERCLFFLKQNQKLNTNNKRERERGGKKVKQLEKKKRRAAQYPSACVIYMYTHFSKGTKGEKEREKKDDDEDEFVKRESNLFHQSARYKRERAKDWKKIETERERSLYLYGLR